jgi:bcr-type benzoyl-CoA reductase subunit C
MDSLEAIKTAVNDPITYVRKLKEQSDKKVVGYMCSYAPEEIIFAAGAHPLRLFSSNRNIFLADGHLQAYCCSLVRGILEDVLSGDLGFLDGMIFPHTCDSVQRLSDIWRLNVPEGFHLDVVLPVKLDTASAREYMINVLNLFRNDLEKALKVKITDDDLRKSIALYNEIRSSLTRIYELKSRNPQLIKGKDVYALLRSSMIMERSSYAQLLQSLVEELEKSAIQTIKTKKLRLFLSGGLCSHPDIYSVIEDAGGDVVGDDLCTGFRYFAGMINTNDDPINAIADRYLQRINCPAKHIGNKSRAENLIKSAKENNADGVIFMLLKFCDPHAFDYPYLKDALDKAKIPNLLLEVEDQPQAQGQMKTRIEAFLEAL